MTTTSHGIMTGKKSWIQSQRIPAINKMLDKVAPRKNLARVGMMDRRDRMETERSGSKGIITS